VNTKIENNPKHAQLAADFQWGKDLGGSDETIISQMHEKPVFVTHCPRQAKAFYMKTGRDNENVVLNFDLLAPAPCHSEPSEESQFKSKIPLPPHDLLHAAP
jgi:aspartyl/asparaginyl-tRNA synthetase